MIISHSTVIITTRSFRSSSLSPAKRTTVASHIPWQHRQTKMYPNSKGLGSRCTECSQGTVPSCQLLLNLPQLQWAALPGVTHIAQWSKPNDKTKWRDTGLAILAIPRNQLAILVSKLPMRLAKAVSQSSSGLAYFFPPFFKDIKPLTNTLYPKLCLGTYF